MPCGEFTVSHHPHHQPHHRPTAPHAVPAVSGCPQQRLPLCENIINQFQPPPQDSQPPTSRELTQVLNLNNLNQMMAAVPSRMVGAGGGGGQKHGSTPAPHPHHHLTVDVNLNHVMSPTQSMKSPLSPNPLDNENLRRQSTGLSAFNDFVDLVKRHLMYAVREEVEILKQQIGEMMERIGQLEYENTVLKSEAKPETLSKLLLPRVTQAASQQILPSGGASGGAGGVPTSAGVASQQQQSNVVVAQTQQKPPTPNGQQTTIAMLPPQQAQTISSGTSTPTPQHMQQQQQQQHLHQTSTSQPGQTPMS